ncbi:acetyl-CoA carboxylase biotin carboxylase subunit family protein [Streptomyces sp. NBC_00154]|uniref:ATP-grasp domain-containing protein n=1 Tax=Streptomyces sp. NBC_00154 TaxID=2975670 RepID=UPI0022547407|nr:ATP-grasp domain-containing protein [Streptomyces sp. NBC_00154]MCX5312320.1 ATP-grasp domain-containing protein [Streptomyces sp. NBC_00154]
MSETNLLVYSWNGVSLEALLDRGARVTLVFDAWEATHRSIDPGLLARVDRHYVIRSYDALDEVAQLAVELRSTGVKIDRVLSLSEFSQFSAGYMASLLGLGQPSIEKSVLMRDKRAMKERATRAGIACARHESLSTTDVEGSVRRVEERLGFPVIVKPAAGLGSVATSAVNSSEELTAVLRAAGSGTEETGLTRFLIAEEPIDGDEYHVDAVWENGTAQVLGVSRYLRPRMLVTTPGRDNGSILLPRDREPELYAEVEELHARINAAFEITDDITHLEIFRRADGRLWFSEMATRFAGGAIPESFKPYGADLRELWIDAVVKTDREPLELRAPAYPYVGWINLAPAAAGVITQEPTDEQIAAFPYVLDIIRSRAVGFEIEELHPSVWCLMLVISADSEQQFRERAAELEAALLPAYATAPAS